MRKTHISVMSAFWSPWAIVFLLVSTPRFGSADLITVGQLSDLMIENQGLNADLIGRFFGPDENSPLTFSSDVNFANFSFQFSLPPMVYLGQTLALTGTGSFDPTTGFLNLASAGSFGSTSWTTMGTEVVTLSPDGLLMADVDLNFLEGGILLGDGREETFERTDGSVGDFGFDTDENGDPVPFTTRLSNGQKTAAGNWTYQSTSETGLVVNSVGFTPPTGGPGSFTTVVAPVPEPAPTFLIGAIVLAVVIVGRRRTRRESADKSII